MNKKDRNRRPTLGELILAVSSTSKNNREAVAKFADLFERGLIPSPRKSPTPTQQ